MQDLVLFTNNNKQSTKNIIKTDSQDTRKDSKSCVFTIFQSGSLKIDENFVKEFDNEVSIYPTRIIRSRGVVSILKYNKFYKEIEK